METQHLLEYSLILKSSCTSFLTSWKAFLAQQARNTYAKMFLEREM